MAWLVLGVLSLLPLSTYVLVKRFGHTIPAILAAGVVGAGLGWFLASAAAALATSVSPSSAMARGGGFGFLGGAAMGGLAAAVERVWRRFRVGHDDDATRPRAHDGAG